MAFNIYTDGACLGNPGPGGWGVLIEQDGQKKELSGGVPLTTNNRMELLAVIEALRFVQPVAPLTVYTDSQYVKNGITVWIHKWQAQGWKTAQKKPVKNQDLWQDLLHEVKRHRVTWQWVKGHSGHAQNEHADFLATKAAKAQSLTP